MLIEPTSSHCGCGEYPLSAASTLDPVEALRRAVLEDCTHGVRGVLNAFPHLLNASLAAGGETALHLAARLNSFDALQELLRLGANVHWLDHDGNTALHLVPTKAATAAAVLVLAGANVQALNAYGQAPQHPLAVAKRVPLKAAVPA
jgi:hypothetical protein